MEAFLAAVVFSFVMVGSVVGLVIVVFLLGGINDLKTQVARLTSHTTSELDRLRRELWAARGELQEQARRMERAAPPQEVQTTVPTPAPQIQQHVKPEHAAWPSQAPVVPAEQAPVVPPQVAVPPLAEIPNPVVPPQVAVPPLAEIPTPPPPHAPQARPAEVPTESLEQAPTIEEQIGLVWFTRIGAAVLLLGVAYFFKYALDNEWIGPLGRVCVGVATGMGVLGFAQYTRPKTRPIFANAIVGIGLSIVMFSAYVSHAFYSLVPASAAIFAIALVAVGGGALAVRYRAEVVLVLSSIAALSAPVLLSTGQDRPLALFSYAFVVMALSHVASVAGVFRFAPWVSILGSAFLYLGWYGRFFDVAPGVSTHLDTHRGTYAGLGARAVPIGVVLVFGAELLGVYFATQARGLARMGPLVYLVVSLVGLHFGSALMLFDHPVWLAWTLALLAAVTVVLERRESKPWLFAISLVASGLSFACTFPHASKLPLPTVLGLGVWAALHTVALLRTRPNLPALVLSLVGMTALVFVASSALVLGPHHHRVFLLLLCGVSLALILLSEVRKAPWLSLVTLLLSSLFMLVGLPRGVVFEWEFLGIVAFWAATFISGGAFGLLARKETPGPVAVATSALASLLFVAFLLGNTHASQDVLRASALATVGAINLAVAGLSLRTTSTRLATVPFGLGVALFAAAAGVLFSGFTITLVWAALAATVCVLAAREDDTVWLVLGDLLFFAVLIRLLAFDLQAPREANALWFSTDGAKGQLVPPFLLNARAYAFAGTGAALFASARACGKGSFRVHGSAFAVLGHIAVLVVTLSELPGLAFSAPDLLRIPVGDRVSAWEIAVTAQAGWVSVATTLALGGYAVSVLGLGFGIRSALHRYLGLALFVMALLKLGAWDIWNLERVYQIGALVGTGGLLLGASFLYARFGKRLLTLFRTGTVAEGADEQE